MSKVKLVLLVIVLAILIDFAVENPLPHPELKLLYGKLTLGQLPTFLLAYISLALGLVLGWLAHVLRIRKKRRLAAQAAQAQAAPEQPAQPAQPGRETPQ